MHFSLCSGGRNAIALKPQKRPIYKFFALFREPKRIPANEIDGLTDDQIKSIYKESGGYFTVGYATTRNNKEMEYATMVVIDGDVPSEDADELSSIETVHNVVANRLKVRHLIHSSWSPGRWRLILPLDSQLRADEIAGFTRAVVAQLNEFGVSVGWVKENGIISQPWFKPVVIGDAKYTIHWKQDGESIDPLSYAWDSEGREHKKRFDKEHALKKILDGEELHTTSNSMIMSMLAYGFGPAEVQAAVQGMLLAAKAEMQDRGDYTRVKDIEARIKDLPRSVTGAVQKLDNKNHIELPDLPETEVKHELAFPPGVMGELAEMMYERAIYPIKEVSIVSALGIVSGVGGRTYNINNCGINLYLTLLMRTGMGKDAIQKFITQILTKYPQGESFIGSKTYTSGKALAEELRLYRARLCVFTEAGFMYRTSSGNQEGLQRNILDYFSKSGKHDVAMGEKFSSSESSVEKLKAPSLTIINESTPEIFNTTMAQRDAVNTGERARMLAFNITCPKPHMNRNHGPIVIPPHINNRFETFFRMCKHNQQKDDPDVLIIEPPPDYIDIYNTYVDRENDAYSQNKKLEATCLSRVGEKLNRLWGAMAAIENPGKPVISQEIQDWAISLIEYEMNTVYNFTGADSEHDFHRDVVGKIIIQLLKDQGPKDTRDPKLHKRNRFAVSHLNKMLSQRRQVADYLGHDCRTVDTLKIIDQFVSLGYLHEPRIASGNRRVCEVTPIFLELFTQDSDD